MKHATSLLIGGLAAVITLILYEQSQQPVAVAAVPSAAVTLPTPNPAKPQSASQSTMNAAAQTLPQFSAATNPTVIDMAASASFNGSTWTCPNGDIPYYDPSINTVYCVLPGLSPSQVTPDLLGGI